MTTQKRKLLPCSAVVALLGLVCGTSAAQSMEASTRNGLQTFLAGYLKPPVQSPGEDPRYFSAPADLSEDGNREVIVYLKDNSWCGSGGCTTLVLVPEDATFRVITKITVTRLPIRILDTTTNGWHDLSVTVGGGGILNLYEAKLVYDGKTYPSNPSVPPAKPL